MLEKLFGRNKLELYCQAANCEHPHIHKNDQLDVVHTPEKKIVHWGCARGELFRYLMELQKIGCSFGGGSSNKPLPYRKVRGMAKRGEVKYEPAYEVNNMND